MPTLVEKSSWLEDALSSLSQTHVAVFGDFCLDAYWSLDEGTPELSVETELPVRRVCSQHYSLGGAGNVVANLAALGLASIHAIAVVGRDLFGGELLRLLEAHGANQRKSIVIDLEWQTMVYAKPCAGRVEENRIDFGGFNTITNTTVDALIGALEQAASLCNVVVLNQQIAAGVSNPRVIEQVNACIAKFPKTIFVVDARHRSNLYRGAVLKLNVHEAALFLGNPTNIRYSTAEIHDLAHQISKITGKPVFVTRGEDGIVVADGTTVHDIPGIQVIEDTDPVGAGDTVVSAIAAALGGGQSPLVAARLANIAAMITVRKLQTTGTATPAEIRAVGSEPDYNYEPELSESPHRARYLTGTEIEVIHELPTDLKIEHCIFDHDGTLSTMREGWEEVMEPMMMRAILSASYSTVSPTIFAETTQKVRKFIDKTTGIQTLVQMKGLADLVRQSGYVQKSDILDEHGYKAIFNELLMLRVQERVDKVLSGDLNSLDFQIKNAALLLDALHQRGVKLYLASGTDQADVIAEATAMGYAHYFEGRIFGATGYIKTEAKKMVLEKIIAENKLSGHQFATFGDGPVEMRETRKRGGLCIGIASDELRRFGWNYSKRTRLIRAGATLIVPDFSQLPKLLKAIHLA